MTRRECIRLLAALAAAGACVRGRAQGAQRRVAIVAVGNLAREPLASLVEGLAVLGHVEGREIELLAPSPKDEYASLTALAEAAVRRKAEVIVTFGTTATQAARKATGAIPIVMVVGTDPVAQGFVKNLAHPEANVTGLATATQLLVAKRLELLKDVVPGLERVAVLWNPASSGQGTSLRILEQAGKRLAIQVIAVEFRAAADAKNAAAAIARARAQALIAVPSTMYIEVGPHLVRLAAEQKLPAIYTHADFVAAGGLMSYSPDLRDQFRRAAGYVDRILKGASPRDLPVEQPTKFELVVNRATARAQGIAIPQAVLLRADRVLE